MERHEKLLCFLEEKRSVRCGRVIDRRNKKSTEVHAKKDLLVLMSVTFPTCHLERSLLKAGVYLNISCILVTADTSHFERSELNAFAALNISLMFVTAAVFHLEMSTLNA